MFQVSCVVTLLWTSGGRSKGPITTVIFTGKSIGRPPDSKHTFSLSCMQTKGAKNRPHAGSRPKIKHVPDALSKICALPTLRYTPFPIYFTIFSRACNHYRLKKSHFK